MKILLDILRGESAKAILAKPCFAADAGRLTLVEREPGRYRVSKVRLAELHRYGIAELPIVRVGTNPPELSANDSDVQQQITLQFLSDDEAARLRSERDPWNDTNDRGGRTIFIDRGDFKQEAFLELEEATSLLTESYPVARLTLTE